MRTAFVYAFRHFPMDPGERLGPYEVVSAIGAGGMGEVFKAHDTRLDRDVAIKRLAPQLARDPDALARFEREALSVAKLSHPNILAIYEFGRQGDIAFVVTELVDGETLRHRLTNGPLVPRRAVAYAQQIARGIAAAHARGIVHRDLKPENVMIGRDDQVKILDFGLAKPIAATSDGETRALSVQTSAGTVLGSFGYMAPEQVRGLAVDHRADIFAFGAVLYEMLSGERAFKGETAADTMTAILTKEPPELDVAHLAISPALDRIVRRCLEKSPDLRFQSANDLAFALETLSTTSTTSGATTVRSGSAPRGLAWLPWAVAMVAIAGGAVAWFVRPAGDSGGLWQRFTQLTDAAGEETAPTMSPDGNTVAYVMQQNGRWGIFAQRVGGRNATPIVVDPEHDLGGPAYSPDGNSIAFHESDADGGIFVAGATGESARRLTDFGFDPAWSPDGKSIVFTTEEVVDPSSREMTSSLYVVDAAGGAPHQLDTGGDAIQAAWSPSGRRLAYWSNTNGQRDIYTVPANGGPRVAVTSDPAIDWAPTWSPDGRYLYFSSDRGGAMNVWRVAIDEASGKVQGQPETVTNGVQAWASLPRFSKDGSRMAFRSLVRSINPVAVPFDPATGRTGQPRTLDRSNNYRIPSDVSPDGRQLAFFALGERQEDIFIGNLDASHMRRLTDDLARDRAPMFTRDGKSVVFYSTRGGDWEAWMIRTDGSELRKILSMPGSVNYAIPSPVDDSVVVDPADNKQYWLRVWPDAPSKAPEQLAFSSPPDTLLDAMDWSADGSKLAGIEISHGGHNAHVVVYDLSSHQLTIVSDDTAPSVRWLGDSRHVIYFDNHGTELVTLDTVTRQRTVVTVQLPGPSVDDMFAITRDGRTIYYGAVHAEADIWIAERK